MIPHTNNNLQSGVTLMLAVLVLAGITAVAFSIAAIVLVEIRSSGDLLRTEPAVYAVQSSTEEVFYSGARSISSFPFTSALNGVALAVAARTYDTSPKTYSVFYNAPTKFSLADPQTPFQNSYTTITVNYVSPAAGTNMTVDLYQYQSDGTTGLADTRTLNSSTSSWTITINNYTNAFNSEFELVLNTNNTNNATALITSARTGTPSSGLPLIGRLAYDVSASYAGLTRKYTVSIPTPQ